MAFTAFTGSFAANTSTGNQTVDTGTGVQGQAIRFWGTKQTADGNAVNFSFFLGAATSSTQRWSVWYEELDAQATSRTRNYYIKTACIEIRDTPTTNDPSTANGRADFVSFGTGGSAGQFTINWSDAPSAAYIINYTFFGGADITNAKAGSFVFPATGTPPVTQDVTDPGFQPDWFELATIVGQTYDLAPPNETGAGN